MTHSESITEIAVALSKVQKSLKPVLKTDDNLFFKSKYAGLPLVWESCRNALAENGLAVIQGNDLSDGGVVVETMLVHVSGQWVKSAIRMEPKDYGPQSVGSCITYARRYGLCSMVGIVADDDDDAEKAEGRETKVKHKPTHESEPKPESMSPAQIKLIQALKKDLGAAGDKTIADFLDPLGKTSRELTSAEAGGLVQRLRQAVELRASREPGDDGSDANADLPPDL